jgi:hypothetical protein
MNGFSNFLKNNTASIAQIPSVFFIKIAMNGSSQFLKKIIQPLLFSPI